MASYYVNLIGSTFSYSFTDTTPEDSSHTTTVNFYEIVEFESVHFSGITPSEATITTIQDSTTPNRQPDTITPENALMTSTGKFYIQIQLETY